MLLVLVWLSCVLTISATLHPLRTARVKILHRSMYVAAYHLHAMGTFSSVSLRDCMYQCQNNDYCRTANYFTSDTGTMCSLFEEHAFVGRILSVFSATSSTMISFDLCPPGFTEPAHICFGFPVNIQPPVSVQQALDSLRFLQKFSLLTYHPIVLPSRNTLYLPVHTQKIVQLFDWLSLKVIGNLSVPLPLYSYDTDVWDNLLQSSSSSKIILVSGRSSNWSESRINYYAVFLSDTYVVAVPTTGSPVYILNSTTGQYLFNCTMPSADNLWARIINHQLYITSMSGLRRLNLTQGASATPVTIGPIQPYKQIFFDASGRLYIEKYDSTSNNSLVLDLNGTTIASYSSGSKLIVKASKYTFFLFNNQVNPLLLYAYP